MKTILIAYDDTDQSKRALERGAALAKAFDAKVVVTSVALTMTPAPRGGGIDPIESKDAHRDELARATEALAAQGIKAETILAVGDPVDAIVEAAKECNADLIVVGTREHGFIGRMFGQSVSAGVSHAAACDVLIVH